MPQEKRVPEIDLARWQKLSPFLDQALEREGGERAAWLEALHAEHPELAQDVQRLLLELQTLDEQGFLQKDPAALVLDEVSLKGQTLGAYRLESLIGRGGMGSVWLARRSDGHFEGKVAVKLLNLALVGRGGGKSASGEKAACWPGSFIRTSPASWMRA